MGGVPGTIVQLSPPSAGVRAALASPSQDVWQHARSIAKQGSPPKPRCPGFLLEASHVDVANHRHGFHAPPGVKLSWHPVTQGRHHKPHH